MAAVTLIAECASNHGGSIARVEEFVAEFAAVADILKFQATRVRRLAKTDPQYDWFARAELGPGQARDVVRLCLGQRVVPMFTVYHPDDVPELLALGLPYIKIGSGEAHSGKLAEAILREPSFRTIYVSEGLYPVHESYRGDGRVQLLGCVSRYPAPHGLAAIRMQTGRYGGWSDHAIGLNECQLAIALGAQVIEKHAQWKTQARPPQPWEATAEEFGQLRAWANQDPTRFLNRWNHG